MKKLAGLLSLLLAVCLCVSALADADGIYIKEEDGGHFEPLPINLDGGSPLPSQYKYNTKYQVYEDPTIRVDRYRVEKSQWSATYYYAIITIRDPSQLRTAPAGDSFTASTRRPVQAIAKQKRAVIAIDGDYCAAFSGNKSNNYILRQGTLYRDTVEPKLDLLIIDEDGDFHVITADEDPAAADKTQWNGKKAVNVFQFGPALVIDGQAVEDEKLLDYGHSPAYSEPDRLNQRMAIAQIGPLTYMVVCCAHYGLNLVDFRDLVMSLADVKVAYTLDGGNSAQMVFLGQRVNNVSKESGSDRGVTDIIYFASAWFTDK
ncbi:MAG: phosphodiester glycosidase family protein [Clostridiales bacterium]|nr:phosphodiester glycosidase family protein [Clostridiales bacterium]